MRLEDLMERAAQYDENLARDIKDYVHGRKYGLVYEASKPEFVRMWKKPVVRGDIVNILPPRGVMEDTKNEDDPSEIVYKVIAISEGVATLRNEKTGETVTASVDDIVALARFDKPIYAGLKEIGRVERGGDKPYHVVINGENYHALQTLVYVLQVFSDLMRGLLGDYRIIMSSEQNNSGKPLDENGMKKVAESAVSSTITFVNGIKKRADYHFGEYIENHYLNTFVDLVKKDQNLQWLTDK